MPVNVADQFHKVSMRNWDSLKSCSYLLLASYCSRVGFNDFNKPWPVGGPDCINDCTWTRNTFRQNAFVIWNLLLCENSGCFGERTTV